MPYLAWKGGCTSRPGVPLFPRMPSSTAFGPTAIHIRNPGEQQILQPISSRNAGWYAGTQELTYQTSTACQLVAGERVTTRALDSAPCGKKV